MGHSGSSAPRRISDRGLSQLQRHEGLRLYAYDDASGKRIVPGGSVHGTLTIGYGHTGSDVYPGQTITKDKASELLSRDLDWAEGAVRRYVNSPLNQNQFDALVIFTYNVGTKNFRRSSLVRVLNEGKYQEAADKFLDWRYTTIAAKKVESDGLLKRRKDTRRLFLS